MKKLFLALPLLLSLSACANLPVKPADGEEQHIVEPADKEEDKEKEQEPEIPGSEGEGHEGEQEPTGHEGEGHEGGEGQGGQEPQDPEEPTEPAEEEVEPTLEGIELVLDDVKTKFIVGEEFDCDNIVVNGTFSDGNAKEILVFDITEPDLSTHGEKEVIVTVDEFSASYIVTAVYNAEKVCNDFNDNLAAHGYTFKATFMEEYSDYELSVNFGASTDESEDNLFAAISTLASFLPEYMEVGFSMYGDPTQEDYYDLFGDESIYAYAELYSPDALAEAALVSYVYNAKLYAQLSIFDC